MRRFALPLMLVFVVACTAETSSPAVADHFEVVSGDAQRGRLNGELDAPIIVRLIDDHGHPMAREHIYSSTSAVDATIEVTSDSTDRLGGYALRWTLGSTLGVQSLHLRTSGDATIAIGAEATALQVDTMASGLFFACGIDPAGSTWCWGDNYYGRLGVDDYTVEGPTLVGADSLHFIGLTVGDLHACGRTAIGEVFCWGANFSGQLGNGRQGATGNLSSAPVRVVGLPPVRALDAGRWATCALTTSDEVWCWGAGAGTPSSDLPRQMFGGATFRAIALGRDHGCGITTGDSVECWGDDTYGQLGSGAGRSSSPTPLPIARPLSASQIVSGEAGSCALEAVGRLYCWGDIAGLHSRERDSLGTGYPALMDEAGPVRGVSLGWYCGAIWAAVGAPRFLCRSWQSDVETNGANYSQVEFGSESLCVRTAAGVIYCKSYSDTGSLPYYDYKASAVPAP